MKDTMSNREPSIATGYWLIVLSIACAAASFLASAVSIAARWGTGPRIYADWWIIAAVFGVSSLVAILGARAYRSIT